jgi:hypothetical protein
MRLCCRIAVLILLSVYVVLGATASAQQAAAPFPWSPPQTPWGDPDLQGVFSNEDEALVPMERPERFAGRSLDSITPEELASWTTEANAARGEAFRRNNPFGGSRFLFFVRTDLRPSRAWLVVDPPDGKIPSLTALGRQRQASFTARLAQPPRAAADLSMSNRCISLGLPGGMMPLGAGFTYQIVQAPGYVAIRYESTNDARVIPLDGRIHTARNITRYLGDSRGRWEGVTLVIHTTNFKGRFQRTSAAGDNLQVVERFKPLPSGSIEWTVTLDDDGWSRPWTFSMRLTKVDDRQAPLENACHEGNYTLRNMLSAARADESATTDANSK